MPILLPAYVTSSTSGTPTSIPATPSGPAILPIDAPSNEISLTGVVVAVLGILMTAVMTAVGFWLARNRLPNIETAHRFVESVRDAFGLDPQEQATTSGGTAPTHEQTAGAADGSEPASSLQQRRTPNSIVPEVDTMELDDLASTLEQQGSAFGEQPGGSVQEPGPASSLQQHSNLNPVETEVYGIELDALATSQQHSRTFEQSGYGEAAHGLSCSQAPTHENEAANNASSLERSALSLGAPIIASDIEHLPGEHGAANGRKQPRAPKSTCCNHIRRTFSIVGRTRRCSHRSRANGCGCDTMNGQSPMAGPPSYRHIEFRSRNCPVAAGIYLCKIPCISTGAASAE
ncbi:hypothetical protein NA56DRAFT_195089 [Hyaloscypha hepaticicola]|uniref:Transmembrane protein n=1 Tax=Hyaloscypha hepaticicola TaxID=2082293 RepID=A0A2J6PZY6_9HELO|nr:hypothetical protein NA56DRAFT_195089 [Hyaloscypha hepaticicola]